MTIKSALSVVALAAGLIAAPVLAQDMIGSQSVSEADRAAVSARCLDLQAGSADATANGGTSSTSTEDAVDTDDSTPTFEDDVGADAESDETVDEVGVTLDLDAITLEDCEASGWYAM